LNVGFTGAQTGMSEKQRDRVREVLTRLRKMSENNSFRYGACVGADSQAMLEALHLGYTIVAFPANNVAVSKHGIIPITATVMKATPALLRNHTIVDGCDVLIAAPDGPHERLRSGTWATVRYARRRKAPIVFCWPDGRARKEIP
jgi:hypothetical protein